MENQEPLDQFDDERILKSLVTPKEKQDLGAKLVRMYLERAKEKGIPVKVLTNQEEYQKLRQSKKLFSGDEFYLLIDEALGTLRDMTPVVYHLLDTKEGLFYGKLGCCSNCSSPVNREKNE